MNFKGLSFISIVLLAVSALSACDKEPPKPQAVVLNFLEAAEAVNMVERVKDFTGAKTKEIRAEMTELSTQYKKELEDKKASFGDDPTQEQQEELKRMTARLQKQFNRARMTSNTQLNKEKNELRESIIDEFEPIARQVAAERGASIILQNNPVFWSEDSLNITSEVISRLPAVESAAQEEPEEEPTEPDNPAEATE